MSIRNMAPKGSNTSGRLRAWWWLHPRFAVLYLGIPLLIFAYLIPAETYRALFGTNKYVDPDVLIVGLIIYGAFLAGSFFLVRTGTQSQERYVDAYCRWVIWPLFTLTMLGYVAWYASAMLNAGGPTALMSALLERLFQPDIGQSTYLKAVLFQTIPGITTLTQLGILYATVEALLWVRRGSSRSVALLRFAPLMMLTLVRAALISERLALIEFTVPLAVVLLSHARWTSINRPLVRFAPLLAGIGIFALFAFGEYFRSWAFYQDIYSGTYLRFAAERFLGYYATAVNNAAVVHYYQPIQPLAHSLTSLFTFPILGSWATEAYGDLFHIGAVRDTPDLLAAYANPEFNNVALIGLLANEYSIFFAPLAAFVLGAMSVSLYTSFARGRMLGLLLYPSWFIGLLEISRIYYWPQGRYFPVIGFLLVSLVLFKLARVPTGSRSLTRQGSRHQGNGARRWVSGGRCQNGRIEA